MNTYMNDNHQELFFYISPLNILLFYINDSQIFCTKFYLIYNASQKFNLTVFLRQSFIEYTSYVKDFNSFRDRKSSYFYSLLVIKPTISLV